MNLLHRINSFIFRPKYCLRNGPDFYIGRFKKCQIMLMRREQWWFYFINQTEVGKSLTPRGAELQAIREIELYFVRGQVQA